MNFTSVKQSVIKMTGNPTISKRHLGNTITSALADHPTSTGHNLKWDQFEIPLCNILPHSYSNYCYLFQKFKLSVTTEDV